MMRLTTTLAAVLLCILAAGADQGLKTLVGKIRPSVHLVIAQDENGDRIGTGTGFIVGEERYLVTNYHVLKYAAGGSLLIGDDDTYLIDQVIAFDKAKDILICSLRDLPKDLPYLSLSSEIPAMGEPVAAIGYPEAASVGLEPTLSSGIVSSIRKKLHTYGEAIQITAPLSPGSSGSPVVTMSGAVIGVATSEFSGGQNMNFAIPGSVVQDMIASADQPLDFSTIVAPNASKDIDETVELWKVEKPPAPINWPVPAYPEIARKAGIEDKVFVTVLVDKEGNVEKIGEVLGAEVFHFAVRQAMWKVKFTPALQDDKPVKVWVSLPITFKLK